MSASQSSNAPTKGADAVPTAGATPGVPTGSTITSTFARLLRGESPIMRSTKVIALVALAVAALYAVHYGIFAVHRQKYLTARSLRTLAAMSTQVQGSLYSARKVLDEHLALGRDSLPQAAPFIPVFDYVSLVEQRARRGDETLRDETLWSGPMVRGCSGPPAATPPLTTSWRPDLARGESCLVRLAADAAPKNGVGKGVPPVRMSLNASAYLESILRHPVGALVFERTILADTAGRILAQSGGSDVGLARLNVIWRNAAGFEKGGGQSAPGWAELRQSPNIAETDIAGTSYKVFIQPCCIGSDGVPQDAQLVVAGLVRKWDFVRDSLRFSLSAFTFIAALLALSVLCWPFVRLWLLGERQRVQLSHGIMLGISALLCLMLTTIFLLDFYAYQKFRRDRDGDLTALSGSILGHFHQEMNFARAQLAQLVLVLGKTNGEPMNPGLFSDLPRGSIFFPGFESWALVDSTGQQRRKWAVDRYVQPLISVKERPYFQNLMNRRAGSRQAPVVTPDWELESIRSWTTGKRQAALAITVDSAVGGDSIPVATMTLSLPSMIGVVLPPSYRFAMIDEEGKVLFHSDASRNLEESFFVEADDNRPLRSAAFARTAALLNITYGGLDHRAHVAPVPERPWTLVTLRDKEPGRVLNLELIATSVWLSILYVAVLVSLGFGALLVRPTYRVPWLWPDRRQGSAYALLAVVLLVFIAAFVVALVRLTGDPLLVAASLLPLLVTLVAYIRLTRREHELGLLGDHVRRLAGPSDARPTPWYGDQRILRAAARCGAVVLGLVAFGAALTRAGAPGREVGALLGLCVLASALALTIGRSGRYGAESAASGASTPSESVGERSGRGRGGQPIVGRYGFVAALYLLLIAVLPATAYFHLAHAAHMGQMVKHGQLLVAKALQDRRARIEISSAQSGEGRDPATSPRLCFQSGISLPDRSPNWCRLDLYPGFVARGDPASATDSSPGAPTGMIGALRFSYPAEAAVEWRGLSEPGAEDGSWKWDTRGRSLFFRTAEVGGRPPIALATLLPALLPASGAEFLGLVLLGALLLLVLSAVVRFLMRRLLLVDVTGPVLVTEGKRLTTLADVNLFVVCRDLEEEDAITASSGCKVIDLQQSSLQVPGILEEVRPNLRKGSPVLLTHFERQEGDPGASKAKLFLLDALVRDYGCSVTVVVGRKSGGYSRGLLGSLDYVDTEPSQGRASDTCKSFVTVDAGRWEIGRGTASQPDALSEEPQRRSRVRQLIESESRYDRNLREIWSGIPQFVDQATRHAAEPGREELLDLLAERAEAYYDSVWEDCQPSERLVLVHVAADGLANGKDRRVLRRLLVRGLIHRRPHFAIMNETFRMYLLRHVQSAERAVEARGRSTWDSVRLPAMVLLVSALGFFFMTQQNLLTLANAVIAGMTAAAAGVAQVVNLLSKRRQGAAG